jgi:hypothetical protein
MECLDIFRAVTGKDTGLYGVYRRKFCGALEYLIDQSTVQSKVHPLQHLWRYLLSQRRRVYAWAGGDSSTRDSDAQSHWMHSLDLRLSVNNRVTNTARLPSYYPDRGDDNAYLHYYWDVLDLLESLKACFRISYGRKCGTFSDLGCFAEFAQSVFNRTEDFTRFRYLDQKFRVNPHCCRC